jgi:hypothetical protein
MCVLCRCYCVTVKHIGLSVVRVVLNIVKIICFECELQLMLIIFICMLKADILCTKEIFM